MLKSLRLSIIFFILILFSSCATYKISTGTFLGESPFLDPYSSYCPQDYSEKNFQNDFSNEEKTIHKNKIAAISHPLYHYIPRHRCQMYWYDLGHWLAWGALGNDDDGIFGEEPSAAFKIEQPVTTEKAFWWMVRNPLHNFCFYVIGSAYCVNSELTLIEMGSSGLSVFSYHPESKTCFSGSGTGFFLGFHGWKPFISLRIMYSKTAKGEFYLGWRSRGNFGIKIIPFTRH